MKDKREKTEARTSQPEADESNAREKRNTIREKSVCRVGPLKLLGGILGNSLKYIIKGHFSHNLLRIFWAVLATAKGEVVQLLLTQWIQK